MKIKIAFLITILLIIGFNFTQVFAQNQKIEFSALPTEKVKASSITWKSHFGGRKEEPENMYTLMTQGGFRAPTSDNFENLIQTWLAKHSKAETVLVYEMEGMMSNNPNSKMKAVWVVEGEENLNIYLVRNGGCPGGTMVLNVGDKTPLTKEEYEAFVKKLIEAEQLAKKEQLGIWSDTQK
ncbi:hypothetical protein BH20ACI4_BH20ACI4_22520 [soil metagenome]